MPNKVIAFEHEKQLAESNIKLSKTVIDTYYYIVEEYLNMIKNNFNFKKYFSPEFVKKFDELLKIIHSDIGYPSEEEFGIMLGNYIVEYGSTGEVL